MTVATVQNIQPWSDDFTKVRTAVQVTMTANNAVAPDGTNTASTMMETASGSSVYYWYSSTASVITPVIAGKVYCHSAYMKALGTLQWGQLGGSGITANFDLVNGVLGNTNGAVIDYQMRSAGNGWWRCWMVYRQTTYATNLNLTSFCLSAAQGQTHVGVVTNGIAVWGGQLNEGNYPSPPVHTDAMPVNNGPIRSIAATQQNKLVRSNAFTTAPWTGEVEAVMAPNAGTDPLGGNSAWSMTDIVSGNAIHRRYQAVTIETAKTRTFVMRVKDVTRRYVSLGDGVAGATFDLTLGTVTNIGVGTGVCRPMSAAGWWQLEVTVPASSASSYIQFWMVTGTGVGFGSYAGDGTKSVLIYEAGVNYGNVASPICHTDATAYDVGNIRNLA